MRLNTKRMLQFDVQCYEGVVTQVLWVAWFFTWLIQRRTAASATVEEQVYIVHMDPTRAARVDGGLGGTKRWYEAVIESIAEAKEAETPGTGAPKLLYSYETVVSGFSARLSAYQVEQLKHVEGFLAATRDELLSLHTTHSPEFLGLLKGKGLWTSRTSAADVFIGVVDTGVWPEHASLNDRNTPPPVPGRWAGICEEGTNFTADRCNRKLVGARAFYKAYEAMVGRIDERQEFRSPRDSEGHGTHIISTAAGSPVSYAALNGAAAGEATGMSFSSRVAVYKACFQQGCTDSDVLAAMEQAVADGVDILSLSLGGAALPYYKSGIAIAAFRARRKGVLVVGSAGNAGPQEYSITNVAPWILTVGATCLDREFPAEVTLGDGRVVAGASLDHGIETRELPLVYADTAGGNGANYCLNGSLSAHLVKGKIVACDRGLNGRIEKGAVVKSAGGVGMLLLNGGNDGNDIVVDAHVLPCTIIEATGASVIRNWVKNTSNPTVHIAYTGTRFGATAPKLAGFSSRGPSNISLAVIKPDVTAPGVNILAAWPPSIDPSGLSDYNRSVRFNILSGTSMSCPHVSGAAALVKSVHPKWTPAMIKSALMTTASPLDNENHPMRDTDGGLATPFGIGSGNIRLEKASNPGLVYNTSTTDFLNHFCSLNYTTDQILLIAGFNYPCPNAMEYHPGNLNYPSFSLVINRGVQNSATVTLHRTVTNVGDADVYAVRVSQPSGVSVTVVPSSLHFKSPCREANYSVHFVASENNPPQNYSFGHITWFSSTSEVRSPIAVLWI